MCLFHQSVKSISRKKGRSAVASAAYRSGERLHNTYDGLTYDFRKKGGIVHTEILLPLNAPPEFLDRQILWNSVEMAEKRCDSRTAREVEIALPTELNLYEQIALVRSFANEAFVSQGMCADIAIHDVKRDALETDNPHAHILLTTRSVGQTGFGKKNRNWDKRENVKDWRAKWAEVQNDEFERKGLEIRVTPESYVMLGIEREPTKHLGHRVTALERDGIQTDRGNENRAIVARNRKRERIRQQELERYKNRSKSHEISR